MSELTEAERRAIHYALDFGHPLSDVDAAVERIIATRLAAAEARAEVAERKVVDAWDEGAKKQRAYSAAYDVRDLNPYRAALDTAAEEQA